MIPRQVAVVSSLFLLLTSVAACKEKPIAPAEVLIRIDQRTVTLDQFRNDFEQFLPSGQQLSAGERDELQRSFLAQLIDRQLAISEAARLGIQVTPAEVDAALQEHRRDYPAGVFEENLNQQHITLEQWRQELQERLLMEKVARQIASDRVKVSEQDIAAYYRTNRDEFDRPAQVRARQIVVADEAEGEKVLALLQQKQPFAEVAKTHSLSPDAEQGGDLGFFGRGEMPAEFDAVVFNLPVGKLSPLVKSEYGYHIFLVEEKRDAVKLTLAQAHDEIRDKLRTEQDEVIYQQWLDDLRSKSKIEVNWALLDKR